MLEGKGHKFDDFSDMLSDEMEEIMVLLGFVLNCAFLGPCVAFCYKEANKWIPIGRRRHRNNRRRRAAASAPREADIEAGPGQPEESIELAPKRKRSKSPKQNRVKMMKKSLNTRK